MTWGLKGADTLGSPPKSNSDLKMAGLAPVVIEGDWKALAEGRGTPVEMVSRAGLRGGEERRETWALRGGMVEEGGGISLTGDSMSALAESEGGGGNSSTMGDEDDRSGALTGGGREGTTEEARVALGLVSLALVKEGLKRLASSLSEEVEFMNALTTAAAREIGEGDELDIEGGGGTAAVETGAAMGRVVGGGREIGGTMGATADLAVGRALDVRPAWECAKVAVDPDSLRSWL